MARMSSRAWSIDVDGTRRQVRARTSLTGAVRVSVDGIEVQTSPRGRSRYQLPVGGRVATLIATAYGRGGVRFDLVLDGRSLTTGGQPRPPDNNALATAIILLVTSLAVLGGTLYFGALPEARLAADGRETDALVTGRYTISGRSTTYHLRYQFTLDSGARVNTEGTVDSSTYASGSPGSIIRVLYVPDDPTIQRPASYDQRGAIGGLAVMFGACTAFSAWLLWRARRRQALARLVADGTAIRTNATVDTVTAGRGASGLASISYRYSDPEGIERRGTSGPLYAEEAAAYGPGSTATIAYDPANPRASTWIGGRDSSKTVWIESGGP